MRETTPLTPEEEEARWWAEWFKADYSWEGLIYHPWVGCAIVERDEDAYVVREKEAPKGARAASLQDYWRADPSKGWRLRSDDELRAAGELTQEPFGEKHWHIAHLPDRLPDGTRQGWKADKDHENWRRLDAILKARLEAAEETSFNTFGSPEDSDCRAQLDGAVLGRALPILEDASSPLHVSADFIAHLHDANYEGRVFGSGANFKKASFAGYAGFLRTRVNGYATFDGARFARNVWFNRSSFTGYVAFDGARFARDAFFIGANFADEAIFESTCFANSAWFESARFAGYARFGNASFADYAGFMNACFASVAKFDSASFARYINFESASFMRDLNFARGRQKALQAESGALAQLDFYKALCLGESDFSDRVFSEAPRFANARFHDLAIFHGATLHDGVNLTEAKFAFDSDLEPVSWDNIVARLGREGETVPPLSQLAGENGASEEPSIHLAFWRAVYTAWQDYLKARESRSGRADRFEASYRRLKQLMRGIGTHIEEQRFFALELKARQARTDTDIKSWEKWAAAAYGALADYGQSALRPLFWLGGATLVFSVFYLGLAYSACAFEDMSCPSAPPANVRMAEAAPVDGLRALHDARVKRQAERRRLPGPFWFSLELSVLPVADPESRHNWAETLSERQDRAAYAFTVLKLVHRLFALILIFLAALALRRRFQIA